MIARRVRSLPSRDTLRDVGMALVSHPRRKDEAFYRGDRLLALRRRLAIEQVAIGFAIGSIVGVATHGAATTREADISVCGVSVV